MTVPAALSLVWLVAALGLTLCAVSEAAQSQPARRTARLAAMSWIAACAWLVMASLQ